jgi:hypothetical protein
MISLRIFVTYLGLEFKRLLCRRNLLIMAVFLLIALVLVQSGIMEYRLLEADIPVLEKLNKLPKRGGGDLSRYITPLKRFYFMPSPVAVFFSSPAIMKRFQASVDAAGYLDIQASLLDGSAFQSLNHEFLTYSGFILYCGSFLVLLLGYESVRYREYNRFLVSAARGERAAVQLSVYVGRQLLVVLYTALVSVAAYGLALLNGIPLEWFPNSNQFFLFTLLTIVLQLIFYALGIIAGSLRKRGRALVALAGAWMVLLFVIPGLVGKYMAMKSQRTSPVYRQELQKASLTGGLEEEVKRAKEIRRRTDESYGDVGKMYPDPYVGVPRDIDKQFAGNIETYFEIARLFPSTIYLAHTRELSSRGFVNLYNFYRFAALYQLFSRVVAFAPDFQPDIVIGKNKNPYIFNFIGELKNNVFYGKSWYHRSLWTMMTVLLVYFLVVNYLAGLRFLATLRGFDSGAIPDSRQLSIRLKGGSMHMIHAPGGFIRLFYNRCFPLYSRKRTYKGGLDLDVEMERSVKRPRIIYLPDPDVFPADLRVRTLAAFIFRSLRFSSEERKEIKQKMTLIPDKRFKSLDADQRAEAILLIAECLKGHLYIFGDFVKQMSLKGIRRMQEQLDSIKANGAAVVYFNSFPSYNPPLDFKDVKVIHREQGSYKIESLN